MTKVFQHLTPTSHPDLFVSRDDHLVHRRIGKLGRRASYALRLPDGKPLAVYRGAPPVSLTLSPYTLGALLDRPAAAADEGGIIAKITKFASDSSGYIQLVQAAVQVFDMLMGLGDETSKSLATLSQQVEALMQEVGAVDYLGLLRDMDKMRGSATALTQMLANEETREKIQRSGTIEQLEFAQGDFELHANINALLDPDEGYFRRAYYEALIRGDGNWETAIPDRPVDENGTSFEHRLAMPTVMYLIAVRLGTMKFQVPDFVSRGVVHGRDRQLVAAHPRALGTDGLLRARDASHPDCPCKARAGSRQGRRWAPTAIGKPTARLRRLARSRPLAPSTSRLAKAASTGTTRSSTSGTCAKVICTAAMRAIGHRRGAGVVRPPANDTGLPPMNDATIQSYYGISRSDARLTARAVQDQFGVGAGIQFAWTMFDFAYPGARAHPNALTRAGAWAMAPRHAARRPGGVQLARKLPNAPRRATRS